MNYEYYYNQKQGETPWRNNLIYTSLISEDKKVFVQHYVNDSEYHKGKNQVVDPSLMEDKWNRELKYLQIMRGAFSHLVPKVLDIDYNQRKIYLEIDGVDLWQQSMDNNCSFDLILPDWKDQMLDIIQAHKDLNLYKFSMHPSSYFIVNGRLKSINYFFTYHESESPISLKDHQSHISEQRQIQMRKIVESLGISWENPESLTVLQDLCFESFSTNYPRDFIDQAKLIYK